jgi:hypothetical protein
MTKHFWKTGLCGFALASALIACAATPPATSAVSRPNAAISSLTAATAPLALTKQDLQNMYMTYLRNEGYVPSIDKDGDIEFKVQGDYYYVIVNDDDPTFFEIYEQITFSTEEHRQNAADAMAYANRRTKVAKAMFSSSGESAVLTIQVFLGAPEDFEDVFPRMFSALMTLESNFFSQL